ncbi:MAG: hypothetical protein JNK04_08415 [Myxococcales bacterium]|nr:hypothetical protein [Myxococcales bacterium]
MMKRGIFGFLLACLVGCGAGNEDSPSGGPAAGGNEPMGGGSGAGTSDGGSTSSFGGAPAGGAPPVEEIAEVFGHSASELYKLDPDTKAVTLVGQFNGCSSVIDIALDKDSRLVGSTNGAIYEIDKTTAACTEIATGGFPNSLSFIPAGTLDPNAEALVGYNGDQYIRIDPLTGAITNIGSLNAGGLSSSGDIVSVKDGGTYLTVIGNGCATDCLLEVNPATGAMIKNWGPVGYGATYGIAFWAGSVYGFSEGGNLFELTFDNNVMTSTLISSPGTAWWGAGSTTSAPPIEVPN